MVVYEMGSTAVSDVPSGQMISGQAISGHGRRANVVVTAAVLQVVVDGSVLVGRGSVMGPTAMALLE